MSSVLQSGSIGDGMMTSLDEYHTLILKLDVSKHVSCGAHISQNAVLVLWEQLRGPLGGFEGFQHSIVLTLPPSSISSSLYIEQKANSAFIKSSFAKSYPENSKRTISPSKSTGSRLALQRTKQKMSSALSTTAFSAPISLVTASRTPFHNKHTVSSRHSRPQPAKRVSMMASSEQSDELRGFKILRENRQAKLESEYRGPQGWTPYAERVNGRLAQLGFVIGLVTEIVSGKPIGQQILLMFSPVTSALAAIGGAHPPPGM